MKAHFLMTLGVLVLALGGCKQAGNGSTQATKAPAGGADGGAVIARYAGKELTTGRAQDAMKRLPGPSRVYLSSPERKRQFIDNLILTDLMFEEGRRQGLVDDPDITQQVDDFRQRLVVQRVMRDLRKQHRLEWDGWDR